MLKAQVAGHVCMDLTPALTPHTTIEPGRLLEVGPMALSAGGCVANTGAALARLGARVHGSARIGNDLLGQSLASILARSGVFPKLFRDEASTTSYSIVIERPLIEGREDRTFWHHIGANATFDGTELLDDLEPDIDVLHLGYPPLLPALLHDTAAPLIALLERAACRGITTSVDMVVVDPDSDSGRRDWGVILPKVLPYVDVFCPSVDDLRTAFASDPDLLELTSDPLELAATLVDMGAGVVVLSDGPAGFFAQSGSRNRLENAGALLAPLVGSWERANATVPARRVEHVVTTNAAGDVAAAALLDALHRRLSPQASLERTAAVAAAHVGGGRFPSRAWASQKLAEQATSRFECY